MLGDGGISQYQIKITLHSKDDKEYSKFVIDLIKSLFDIYPSIYYRRNESCLILAISRVELVDFCVKELGLKKGNKIKEKATVPQWIINNKKYLISCLRGLIDTDGCIFAHSYRVKEKDYSYKKLLFTSYSDDLRRAVFDMMKELDLKPRFAPRRDVRIDGVREMKRYFCLIGSHNLKHLEKWKNELK